MKPGRFSSCPGETGSRLKQTGFRQRRDKSLHINASSQDDFKDKWLQPYHVIKGSQ